MVLYMDVIGFESCSELLGIAVTQSGSIAQLPSVTKGSVFLYCGPFFLLCFANVFLHCRELSIALHSSI